MSGILYTFFNETTTLQQALPQPHALLHCHTRRGTPVHRAYVHTFIELKRKHSHTHREGAKKKYIYQRPGSGENCRKTIQMHGTPAAYGGILIPSHLKWIENWLLSMYIDAGPYIWLHVSNQETNTMQPTLFPDEKISMIVARREPRSHCQKLPTSIVSSQTGATLND